MNELQELAARVQDGDSNAASELRHELETQLVPIVRRAISVGTGRSPLARRILAEAEQLRDEGWENSFDACDDFVSQVARRMCASMVGRLRGGAADSVRAFDTVRN